MNMKMEKAIVASCFLMASALLFTGCIVISFPSIKTSSTASSSVQASTVSSSPPSSTAVSESAQASSSESVSVSASASVPSGTEQTMTGTFEKIEQGDYLHLYLIGEDKAEYSFFIMHFPGLDPETLVAGQKIRITWRNVDEYVSEAQGSFNFDEITKIEVIG